MFEEIGPTPRICIDFVLNDKQRKLHKSQLADAISSLSLDMLMKLASNLQNLDMHDVSHKIVLVSRTQDFELAQITPITSYVKSRLVRKLQDEERNRRLRFYSDLERVPGGRPLAGLIYESLAHQILGANINLHLMPMVKLGGHTAEGKSPQWYSSHQPLENDALEALRHGTLHQTVNIQFMPSTTREWQGNNPDLAQGVYYVPKSKNQVGFDSFIYASDGFLYVFQFTISLNHGINRKMVGFFERSMSLPMEKWRFVFIIPSGLTITCPQSRGLGRMKLFSAVVDPS